MRSRRLTRSLMNRTLGGVCGGLGEYIGINPWWVRVAFMMLGIFTAGTGVLIYLALWWIMPSQSLPDTTRERRTDPETVIMIGFAVIVMGLIVLARNLGILSSDNGDAFLPLVIIAFGLVLLVKQLRRAV
ncbi:MAG TPA: PspC domain-containing protein [Aggregatilineaceae bacterium]|nr:PspC domain-containing protein [Aggregatilineaceae bacterium]